jgi:hypothetical protein
MALIAGEYNSLAKYGGSYYGWHEVRVPLVVRRVDPDLRQVCRGQVRTVKPAFKVEVEDLVDNTTVPLPNVKEVSISRNVQAASDTFNLQLVDARAVSPRLSGTMNRKCRQDIRCRIHIYSGFNIRGKDVTLPVFSGVVMDRKESWGSTGSTMSLDGLSLSYLLTVSDGFLNAYVGTLGGAVEELMNQAGLGPVVMALTDRTFTSDAPLTINEPVLDTSLTTLLAEFPQTVWYIDAGGTVVIKNRVLVDPTPLFTYETGVGILKIDVSSSARAALSEVAVSGGTPNATGLYADQTNLTRFGVKRGQVSSSTILTAQAVQDAGRAQVDLSEEQLKMASVAVPFNPMLDVTQRVWVKDTKFGSGLNTGGQILKMSLKFNAKGGSATFDCQTDEEV